MAGFTKKDLIEAIQDTVKREMATGQKDKNRISDLSAMIKGAVASSSADDEMRSMADNLDELKSLFLKVSEEMEKQTDIAKEESKSNKDREKKLESAENKIEKTFKSMLSEQVSMNKSAISSIVLSSQFKNNSGASEQIISSISKAINSKVSGSFGGQSLNEGKSVDIVENVINDLVKEVSADQKSFSKSNKDGIVSVYKTISGKFSAFFGGRVGSTIYDALNMVTDGQLGVIRSMTSQVGRMGEAVTELYSGISDKVNEVFVDEKRGLIDPVVNMTKGIGGALGVKGFQSTEKKKLKTAEKTTNILKDILELQREQLNITKVQTLISGRGRFDAMLILLKKLFRGILMGIGATIGLVIGGAVGIVTMHFKALFYPFTLLMRGVNGLVKSFTDAKTLVELVFAPFKALTVEGSIIGKAVTTIKSFIGEGSIIGKLIGYFKGLFTTIHTFIKNSKILAPLFEGLAKGFRIGKAVFGKFFFWLMFIVDFFMGFAKTEGSIGDKIIGGLKSALLGIVELPLKILGWVYDKLTDGEGTGAKLIKSYKSFMDSYFSLMLELGPILWKMLKGMFGGIVDIFKGAFKFIWNIGKFFVGFTKGDTTMMEDAAKGLWDGIKLFFSGIGDFIVSLLKGLKYLIRKIPGMDKVLDSEEEDKAQALAEAKSLREEAEPYKDRNSDLKSGKEGGRFFALSPFLNSKERTDKEIAENDAKIAELEKKALAIENANKGNKELEAIIEPVKGAVTEGPFVTPGNTIKDEFVNALKEVDVLAGGPNVTYVDLRGGAKQVIDETKVLAGGPAVPTQTKGSKEFITPAIDQSTSRTSESYTLTGGPQAERLKGMMQDSFAKTSSVPGMPAVPTQTSVTKGSGLSSVTVDMPDPDDKSPGAVADRTLGAAWEERKRRKLDPMNVEDTDNAKRNSGSIIKDVKKSLGTNKNPIPGSSEYDDIINTAATKYGLSPELIKSVIKTESSFNPNAMGPVTKSGERAAGLMQFMPGTAKDMGITDRLDPTQSINGGAKYLSQLSKKYDGDMDKTLAAYNWGPGNVDKYGLNSPKMPDETKNYLKKVKGGMQVDIAKSGVPTGLGDTVNSAEVAKQNVIKRQMEQTSGIGKSITGMNKNTNQGSGAPVIVNTGGEGSGAKEPPSDVESMSILWLNKSWGLG